jgi:hypothetical protein
MLARRKPAKKNLMKKFLELFGPFTIYRPTLTDGLEKGKTQNIEKFNMKKRF